MGQACSSQEAQQMFIEDLNLPCTSVINSNEKHSINNCATVVSKKWIASVIGTGKVQEDIELEKLKKNTSALLEFLQVTHRHHQNVLLQKVNVCILKKDISFTSSFLPSTESDSNSIYEVLLILLKKQKKNLSDFLSKYDHGKPPKQSHEHHYDWNALQDLLFKVFGIRPAKLNESSNQEENNSVYSNECIHLTKVISIIESTKAVYIIEELPSFTLFDGLAYSPAIAGKSYLKLMFLFQQLLDVFVSIKKLGFSFRSSLCLKDIFLSHNALWISLSPVRCLSFATTSKEPTSKQPLIKIYDGLNTDLRDEKIVLTESLSTYTNAWVEGELKNFDYLMILNKISGRTFGDILNHPVFPWVTNFSQPNSGFRDLTKTKFRLNKGDRMLDATFSAEEVLHGVPQMISPDSIPHHVSDVLSDITFYMYHARDTAKDILCKHVRSRWVPNEYPSSMERMFQWTPDECIPEFFYDPNILKSIHNDLSDLSLPEWTADGSEFVKYHYEMLESPNVSRNLHHWIDLVFGYKLGGVAAKQEKNVHLSLVDDHAELRNYGIVQLFFSPHPYKKINKDNLLSESNNGEDVSLSWEYVDISREVIQRNTEKEGNNFPVEFSQEELSKRFQINKFTDFTFLTVLDHVEKILTHEANISPITERGIGKYCFGSLFDDKGADQQFSNLEDDEKLFLCLVIEVLLHRELKTRTFIPALDDRLKENICFLKASTTVSNWIKVAVKDVISHKLRSCTILTSLLNMFSFPNYFQNLHGFLCEFYNFIDECVAKDDKITLCSHLEKYNIKLVDLLDILDQEGLDILIGYLFPLFHQKLLQIPLFLYIFPSLSEALGPAKSKNLFIKDLQKIYENMKTNEDILLVQQSFLSKVLASFGQECFLELLMDSIIDLLIVKNAKVEMQQKSSFSQSAFKRESYGSFEVSPCFFGETESISSLNLETFFNEGINNTDKVCDASPQFISDDSINLSDFNQVKQDGVSSNIDLNAESNQLQVISSQEVHLTSIHSSIIDIDSTRHHFTMAMPISSNCVHHDDTVTNEFINLPENEMLELQKDFAPPHTAPIADKVSSSLQLRQLEKVESIENQGNLYDSCSIKSFKKLSISATVVETFRWFIPWLGPVLTMEYIASPLMKKISRVMLEIDEVAEPIDNLIEKISPMLECLVEVALVYGESIITNSYISSFSKLIQTALYSSTVTISLGSNLVCGAQLMVEACKVLSPEGVESNFENLSETVFQPLIRLLSSVKIFSTGCNIKVYLSRKLIDILGILCQKIKREKAQTMMVPLLQQFFSCFDGIYSLETMSDNKKVVKKKYFNKVKKNPSNATVQCESSSNEGSKNDDEIYDITSDDILQNEVVFDERYEDVYETFSPALAYHAYVLISRILSSTYVENALYNSELVWHLWTKYDEGSNSAELDKSSKFDMRKATSKWFQPINPTPEDEDYQKSRPVWQHIEGNWFSHWQRNLDDTASQTFHFSDCKLQTYAGHSSAIRDMYVAENEHYFLSASRDKTVKLWLLKNHGNGTAHLGCSRTYDAHRKAVFAVQGIESKRLVSSCDGVVHVWDPVTGNTLSVYDSPAGETVTSIRTFPPPSSCIGVATTDGLLRLYDVRQKKVSHCWRLSPQLNTGIVRSMCVSNSGRWIAAGFSNGVVSVVDIRCGYLRGHTRIYDSEITQLETVPDQGFLASSVDSNIRMWSEDGSVSHILKSTNDIIHSLIYSNRQLLWATTNNKIKIHNRDKMSPHYTYRVSSENLKGSLIKMSVLPINKLYLFATDNGNVTLYS